MNTKVILAIVIACFTLSLVALAQQAKPTPNQRTDTRAALGGKTEIAWWGHAAFFIKTPHGASIAIDPWLENPIAPKRSWPEQLDAILVTHGHSDHVGNAIDLAKKTRATVICSFELCSILASSGVETNGANIGGTVRVKDAIVHIVEAVHSSGYGTPLQYAGPAVGYVIEVAGTSTVLYHAGDTDVFSSMQLIGDRYHPTIAMLPVGGHYSMDPTAAALAAKMLRPKIILPMHYGTFPVLTGTPSKVREELRKYGINATVVTSKPGDVNRY